MPSGFGTSPFGSSFSSAPFFTTDAIIDGVLRSTRQLTNDNAERARCLEFINARYLQMLKGRHWNFMERQLILDLLAPYSTGTISATQGSRTITGTGTAFDATMVGQKLTIAGHRHAYRIEDVQSTTELTITNKLDITSVTDSAYKILFDIYQIPADAQAVRSVILNGNYEMVPKGLQEFRIKESRYQAYEGLPRDYTLIETELDSAQRTMQIYPAPDQRYAVAVDYTLRPTPLEDSEDSFPLIPDYHRDVLYYACLADMYRALADNTNYATAKADALLSYSRLAADQEMTDSRARLQPKRNYFNRFGRKHYGFLGLKWFSRVDD